MDVRRLISDVKRCIQQQRNPYRAFQQALFSLLQSSTASISKISQIHTQIIINGLTQKNFIVAKLFSCYTSLGYLPRANKVFKCVEFPSTTLCNHFLRAYAGTHNEPYRSIQLFNKMQVPPDGYTFSFVISVCARGNLLREGEQIHGRVFSTGLSSDLFVGTNLVNLYASAGGDIGAMNARKVLDEMGETSVVTWNTLLMGCVRHGNLQTAAGFFYGMPERNVVSWTMMISGFARNGRCKQALALFREMNRARVGLDQVVLVAALSACAQIGDLDMGRWIHSYVDTNFCVGKGERLISLNNALIHMYASCGEIKEAYELFKRMPFRSTVSWTNMITGLAKQGHGKEALSVFQWMQTVAYSDAKPDETTLLGVLWACSHAGLVREGRYYFRYMSQIWSIQPTIEHYGCMVDILSRAGFLTEAHNFIETMPMKPNDAIWGTLLGGCKIHKNVELASRVAQKLAVDLDPDKAAGYLVLLSNVYASAKKWKNVMNVRQKMVDMGLRKPPGRSWVQIDGIVHDFFASDHTHEHASSIYSMLILITDEAILAGYKPDIFEVQLDMGESDRWMVMESGFYLD